MVKYLLGAAAVLAFITSLLAFLTGNVAMGLLFWMMATVNTIDAVAEHLKGERLVDATKALREYLTNESKK